MHEKMWTWRDSNRGFCRAHNMTPERWSVVADYTIFKLFWAPLNNLPLIVHPQDGWVKWLPVE
jgi:hypothetical protein